MSADRISADRIGAERIGAERIGDVTVLVVDDQRLVREGIASLLNIQEGISVVGQAVNGQEAIERALALRPDVILMDVRMPVMDGIVATAQIHRQLPGCQVIMLTTFDDEEYIVKSLRAGAVGYLLKDIPASQLARAVQLAHAGIYQLEPSVAGKLVGMLGGLPERSPLPARRPGRRRSKTISRSASWRYCGSSGPARPIGRSRIDWWSAKARSRTTSPASSAASACAIAPRPHSSPTNTG